MAEARAIDKVCDTIDIETFLICQNEDEAKEISYRLMNELNLGKCDIVFLEHKGPGARVRLRSYIHHPGDHYKWLEKGE